MKTFALTVKGSSPFGIGKLTGNFLNSLNVGSHAVTEAVLTTDGVDEVLVADTTGTPNTISADIKITHEGDKYCALMGANPLTGIAGYGDTPNAALLALHEELTRIETAAQQPPAGQNAENNGEQQHAQQ